MMSDNESLKLNIQNEAEESSATSAPNINSSNNQDTINANTNASNTSGNNSTNKHNKTERESNDVTAIQKSQLPQMPPNKKKELIRPLFSRSSTNEKVSKNPNTTKNMIVETETVDASKVPSVTLPIASSANVINNELMSNNPTIPNNLSSLRSKKSTLFVDQNSQNNQVTTNNVQSLPNDDNDAISLNGSVRNMNKRLNPAESHLNISKPGATKADLFAAKIANAVGDVSDSDSEETFVYESAPDALNTSNTLPLNKTPGVSSVLGSGNPMALRKISQRNISMPVTSSQPYSPTNASHIVLTNDDSKDQTNRSFDTEDESDNNVNTNTITTKESNSNNTTITNAQSLTGSIQKESDQQSHDNLSEHLQADQSKITKPESNPQSKITDDSNNSNDVKSNNNKTSKNDKKSKVFTKYNGNTSRKPSNASLIRGSTNERQNQLRTTTSKLFEVKGSSLRRYSGVPDDVNIEDYIDQYDEEHEIDGGDYADTYEYDDYEDEDELTPLNVNAANGNLRYNSPRNYHLKSKFPNFRSTDQGDLSQSFGDVKDNNSLRHSNSRLMKNNKKNRNRSQLSRQYSPHNFYNSKKNSKLQILKNFFYFFILVLLLLVFGFIAGFLLATTKDLQDVQILSIDDILVSVDELVFDLKVQAFNPGFVTVEVNDVELDIFAKSSHLGDEFYSPDYLDDSKSIQTILLGSVSKFETPLEFTGGFFNRNHSFSKGEIKLVHPGRNSTDNGNDKPNHKIDNDSDKWRLIINYPFDLIVRGSFKYSLPFFHTDRSVAVTKTISVDPAEDRKYESI